MNQVTAVIIGSLLAAVCTVVIADIDSIQKLAAEGQYDQALAEVEQELQNNPGNVTYRFLKGLVLTRADRLGQARDVFIEITRTNPELPEPYNNLAVLHARQQNLDAAVDALQRAIKTHPAYAVAHENLGDVYAQLASIAYRRALANTGSDAMPENQAQAKLEVIKELVVLPEMPALPTPADLKNALRSRVEGWAQAWSEQRPGDYLDHYGVEFRPPAGLSRAAWEAERRARILAPRFIEVSDPWIAWISASADPGRSSACSSKLATRCISWPTSRSGSTRP